MRTLLTYIIIIFLGYSATAQTPVYDSVSIGAGYTNQTFYSLANGMVNSISNTDWDLAFNNDNREVAIFINSKNGVKLYLASNDTTKWNSLDTTIKTVKQYYNSDSSWSYGAFNREATGFDYGWGIYNSTSHEVYANKIYFLNYGGTQWKKIIISKHDLNYTWFFRYANLDGTNEVSGSIKKGTYPNRNFVYYSIANNMVLDREPDINKYDLIFHQYWEEIPTYYPVTGVQQNSHVKAKKVYPVADLNAANPSGLVLSKNITSIGRDWKFYDMGLNKWVIEDSIVYFVQDYYGTKIYKLIFTGFGGGSTGKMYFTKTAYASGINSKEVTTLGMYPNPVSTGSTINFYSNKTQTVNISIKDYMGREISKQLINATDGFNDFKINTQNYSNGNYIVLLQTAEGIVTQKFIVRQ